MKRIALIAATLATVVCALAAWSQGGLGSRPAPGNPGSRFGMGSPMVSCPAMAVMPPHAGIINQLLKTLSLTKEQTTKLKKIVVGNDKKMRSLQQTAAQSSKALHISLLASKYSAKKTKDLSVKAEKAEAALISSSVDEWTQIRSVLTSKQAANLQKSMSFQRPGPGGPPPIPAQNGAR